MLRLFWLITNWCVGYYQLRITLSAKHIWVAVITRWGILDSPPPLLSTTSKNFACKETFGITGEQWTFCCPKKVNNNGPHWVEILKALIKYFCYTVFHKTDSLFKGENTKLLFRENFWYFPPKRLVKDS